jgi:hypothetical protein
MVTELAIAESTRRRGGPRPATYWLEPITIGNLTKTLEEWAKLAGIRKTTISQRLARGVFPVAALITRDLEGNCLRLWGPSDLWRVSGRYHDGDISLVFSQNADGEHGIDVLSTSVFGEGGRYPFEASLLEFKDGHRDQLMKLKDWSVVLNTRWKEAGQPANYEARMTRIDYALLDETFLRRQCIFSVHDPNPKEIHEELVGPTQP